MLGLYDLINTYKPDYMWSDSSKGPDVLIGKVKNLLHGVIMTGICKTDSFKYLTLRIMCT